MLCMLHSRTPMAPSLGWFGFRAVFTMLLLLMMLVLVLVLVTVGTRSVVIRTISMIVVIVSSSIDAVLSGGSVLSGSGSG